MTAEITQLQDARAKLTEEPERRTAREPAAAEKTAKSKPEPKEGPEKPAPDRTSYGTRDMKPGPRCRTDVTTRYSRPSSATGSLGSASGMVWDARRLGSMRWLRSTRP
jgi:hypothetical protein